MILHIKVKPSSSKQEILSFGSNRYLVYLTEPPENNRANIELINLLSKYFGTPVSRIKIKTGLTSNEKMIEVS
jgi:uncharacterized protein (TIGR00251 family)